MEGGGGGGGLKFSDNETSPVIVPAVINGVPSLGGSPCPWESEETSRDELQGRRLTPRRLPAVNFCEGGGCNTVSD